MGTVLSTKIKNYYDEQLKNSIDAANKSLEASKIPYNYNISQAASTYQPQRNNAYTQNMTDQRSLRERMANYGLGASGGTSSKLENRLANSLQSNLNSVNLAQQNYIDEQNNSLAQLNAKNQANIADLTAQNGLNMNSALLNQQNSDLSTYLNLYLNGRISKQQFQALTGITGI